MNGVPGSMAGSHERSCGGSWGMYEWRWGSSGFFGYAQNDSMEMSGDGRERSRFARMSHSSQSGAMYGVRRFVVKVPRCMGAADLWGGRNPGLKSETRGTHFPARFQRLGLGCRLALA